MKLIELLNSKEVKSIISLNYVTVNENLVLPSVSFEYEDNQELYGYYDFTFYQMELLQYLNEYGNTSNDEIVARINEHNKIIKEVRLSNKKKQSYIDAIYLMAKRSFDSCNGFEFRKKLEWFSHKVFSSSLFEYENIQNGLKVSISNEEFEIEIYFLNYNVNFFLKVDDRKNFSVYVNNENIIDLYE